MTRHMARDAADATHPQRLTRLTPLHEALAAVDTMVHPVAPRELMLGDAHGLALAADVVAPAAHPPSAIALRDGWAVGSEHTVDAGSYAAAPLPASPPRIGVGDPLPDNTDAVAPLDAVVIRGTVAEAVAAVAPGDGVLPADGDIAAATTILRRAGQTVRDIDAAIFAALGIAHVSIRAPRIRICRAGSGAIIDAGADLIARLMARSGATPVFGDASQDRGGLAAALRHENIDAVIAIGGTGSGVDDLSITILASNGQVAWHGVGLTPGETAAFGVANSRPVLLLPGRIDAMMAVWLVIGTRLLAQLRGSPDGEEGIAATLTRKISSTVGVADVIALKRDKDGVAPLASGYLGFSVLTRADGWIVVSPDSEGYPAGARVQMRPWP